jgi:hypothetical protein
MSKIPLLAALAASYATAPLAAQVGHPPDASPYQDIRVRSSLVAVGGYVAGSHGRLGIGPASGRLIGLQYELALGGPTDGFLMVSLGNLDRVVIDPDAPAASRVTDSVTQSVVFAQAGLSVLLTGEKTWNGFAPYVGGTLGIGFGSRVPQDSSGFGFGTKFVTGPHLGIRWYPTRTVHLRVEGRQLFWQLKYPQRFFNPPARAPTDPPVLSVADDPDAEWTAHPTLLVALGFAFRL